VSKLVFVGRGSFLPNADFLTLFVAFLARSFCSFLSLFAKKASFLSLFAKKASFLSLFAKKASFLSLFSKSQIFLRKDLAFCSFF
jgi:hypothetical protein